jgi:hypothetical protein
MTFRSDLMAFEIPSDVQLTRERRQRFTPRERFIVICIRQRLRTRYHWEDPDVAEVLNFCRSNLHSQIYKQAVAMFALFPDLAKAVCYLSGYEAGRFILEHWDVAVRASCGEQELRASG